MEAKGLTILIANRENVPVVDIGPVEA